jgi:PAS domain S-box-containing protein
LLAKEVLMKTQSKILVVENDPLLLSATRHSLELAGYEVCSASDGNVALELARATQPNLVLTDVELDGLDGFEVCHQLKADPALAGIFVAFFSGSRVDAESRSEGLELGADDYLVRPIGNRELLARVKALLRVQAAEREARQLAVHWQSTFDVVGDAILLTDANFTILQCNRTAGEFFQMEPAEMLGKKCYRVVHESDHPVSICPLERVCQTRRREILTFQRAGRWLEARVDPILAADGSFLGTVHVIADITERVQAEQKLRESEEKYRLLIQNSIEAIYVVQDGLFKFVNWKCSELLGLTEQELSGQSIETFIFPKDIERLRTHHHGVLQGVLDDGPFEIQIRLPEKEAVWLSIRAVRIDWGGKAATLNFANDITARKQADEALRESEDKFKYIFDHSALGKSITLVNGEMQVNQAFCEMLGYTAAELEHRKWLEISHPADVELTQTEIDGLLSGQRETTRFIKRYLHKNGSIVWAEVGTSLRRDATGQPLYFMTSINDISARKQAEQALQSSNSYLQAVLDAVADAIFIEDAETGQIIDVNQGMCALYGYSRAEALEISIAALSQGEPPYSPVEILAWLQKARECGPQTFEWLARRKNGQLFWVEINLRLTAIGGENRFVVVVRDISERKQAELVQQENEQRLRALIDHAPFGAHLYELEADQRLVFRGANQAADLIFGLDHRQFIGKTIEAAFPGLSQSEIPAAYRRVAVTGETFSLEQVDYNEGAIRGVFEIHAVQTGPGRMAVFFRDITERYKAEAALRTSEARFHLMFENHSAILLLIEPETGQILDANQGAVKFYGYPKAVLCGMQIDQINNLPPEQVAAERQRAILAQQNYFVFPHKLASGEIRLVEVHSSPIAYQDKQALFSIIHDVTERKLAEAALRESEEKYRRLFENSPLGIFQSTAAGEALSVNPAFAQMFGYASQAEAIEKLRNVATDLFADPNRRAEIIRLMAENPNLRTFENVYRRKDGSTFIGSLNSMLVRDEQGHLLRIEGLIEDITERKRSEAALRKNNQMLLALHNVAREMGGELRLPVLSETILAAAEEMLAVDRGGGIYLYEARGQVMRLVKGSGINRGREGLHVPLGQGVVGRVFQTAQPLVVEDYSRWAGRTTVLILDPPSTVLGVPLFLKGEVIGVLTLVANSALRKFSPEDVQQAEMFAAQAAIAIQNARLYEQAQAEITERIEAETALRQNQAKLQAILDYSPALISIKDLDGNLILANQGFAILDAPPLHELLGKNVFEIFPREVAEQLWQNDLAALKAQGPVRSEEVVKHLDGTWHTYFTVKFPIYLQSDQPFGICAISNDITERKQAEATLRESQAFSQAILDNSPLGISVRNPQGGLLSANAAWQKIWAMPADVFAADLARVRSTLQFDKRDAYLADSQEAVRHVYQTGGYLHLPAIKLEHPRPGGAEWISQHFYALQNEQGQVQRVVILTEDITQAQRAEEALREYSTRLEAAVTARTQELREAQEQLVRQEKLAVLGQLAGGVGHELRNPLNVISNASYFLRLIQPEAGEKVREYLGIIETETQNAEKIISDLLDFSRIKSVDLEPVTVSELVGGTLERFPAPENVHVNLDLPADLPCLYLDPRQLTQVLGNLVTNACQAMTSGTSADATDGGALTLSAAPAAEAGYLVLTIRDTGPGITPENLKKLFEPLFTTKPRGIGLGLAVSKKLVEANSGRIEVETQVGQGTTFRLILPIQSVGGADA